LDRKVIPRTDNAMRKGSVSRAVDGATLEYGYLKKIYMCLRRRFRVLGNGTVAAACPELLERLNKS
jgi:hypothetical protein